MKKTIVLICFTLLFGMLAGCQNMDVRPLPPENPGSSLINYDPDRQIYIGTENIYMDYYVGLTDAPCLDIPVYSKFSFGTGDYGGVGPVRVELCWSPDIELDIMQCWMEVTQVDVLRKTEFMAAEDDAPESVMPYYVYQAYRGGNAAALANAKIGYKPDSGMTDPLRADFEALTAEDLPEFYVYNIRIYFEDMPVPEPGTVITLEKLKLTVDGQTYEAKFGGVTLRNQEDWFPQNNWAAIKRCRGAEAGSFSELYSDGIIKILRFCVVDQFKLDTEWAETEHNYASPYGVWALDEGTEILDSKWFIKDQYGQYRQYSNENSTIHEGESAYVDVIVKNENADKLLSNIHIQIAVEWGHNWIEETTFGPIQSSRSYCDVYTVVSTTNTTPYENYAIIFDGVDMEPYYDYYYENYLMWRKEYIS